MKRRRILTLVLTTAILASFSTLVVLLDHWADPDLGACPRVGIRVRPLDLHFEPGFVEHQSWLDFPAPQGQAPRVYFSLCVDDRVVDTGFRGSIEAEYRINVRTRWVTWRWLTGDLAAYERPERWQLVMWFCQPAANQALTCGVPRVVTPRDTTAS